ncbi:MAG: CRTAC1 family protein [Planctomycetota bacterium]|nr:CRTAC1 family protein [Planctomycetota bacterium]
MQKRVDPGPRGDAWKEEVLAPVVEDHWKRWAQGTDSKTFGAATLHAPKSLHPLAWQDLPGSGSLLLREGLEFSSPVPIQEPKDLGDWWNRLRESLRPGPNLAPSGAEPLEAMVQVYRIQELPDGDYDLRVRIRVWQKGDGAAWSRTLETAQVWSFGESPTLRSFQPMAMRDSQTTGPMFVDLTQYVLPSRALSRHSLYAGGIELAGRHDRLFSTSTQYLGMHGLAVGDVNGDGLEDVYLARAGGFANHLFLGQPDGSLLDGAWQAGVADLDDTGGVLICDLDGDGARDLIAGVGSWLVISWNDGRGIFSERTTLLQGPDASMVYSICAADADGDGDLDLYDTRYFQGGRQGSAPTPYHDANNGAPNSFWRNTGDRQFVEATSEMGLDQNNQRFSLAALWEDFDGDGDLDLYVTNDFGRNNLYRNDGGRFVDIAEASDALDMAASMGVSAADVDRDGHVDLYISNMYTPAGERVIRHSRFQKPASPEVRESYRDHARGNSLLMGQGDGRFRFDGEMAGTGPGGWSWGSVFLDFDMNGLPDLVVPNGFATGKRTQDLASFFWRAVVSASPVPGGSADEYLQGWQCLTQLAVEDGYSWNGNERHYAYWNLGAGRFADVSAVSGLDWLEDGRCAAVVDWDMDGRPDLWLAHRTAPIVRFMHNRVTDPGHWLSIELEGQAPNTEAVGALVQVRQGEQQSESRVYAGEGYLGSGSKRRMYGLGESNGLATVTIQWPNGEIQALEGLAVDAFYRIRQGQSATKVEPRKTNLAGVDVVAAAGGSGRPMGRVIPADRLPLAAWDLPDFSRQRPTIGDLGPEPVLVFVYAGWQDGGADELVELSKVHDSASFSLRIVNVDGPRQAAQVQQQLQDLGLLSRAGRGGRRVRNLIDTILGEILGAAKDRELPLGLLFDGEGGLAAIYPGGLPLEQVEKDAQSLRMQASGSNPGGLNGGQWFGPKPKRSLVPLAEFLRRAGEAKLAEGMERWAAMQSSQSSPK